MGFYFVRCPPSQLVVPLAASARRWAFQHRSNEEKQEEKMNENEQAIPLPNHIHIIFPNGDRYTVRREKDGSGNWKPLQGQTLALFNRCMMAWDKANGSDRLTSEPKAPARA